MYGQDLEIVVSAIVGVVTLLILAWSNNRRDK